MRRKVCFIHIFPYGIQFSTVLSSSSSQPKDVHSWSNAPQKIYIYIYIIAYSLSQIICRIFVATQNFSVHVVQSTHFRVITQVQVRSNEGNLIPTLLGMVRTIAVNRLGSRKIALQYDFLS